MQTLNTRRAIDLAFQTNALPALHAPRELLEPLVRAFLKRADDRALERKSMPSLLAQLADLLNFISRRDPHEIKVRVFQPTLECNGYTLPGTVIQTCMTDQSFLFDTLQLLLHTWGKRRGKSWGLEEQLCLHPILELQRDSQGTLTRIGRSQEGEQSSTHESVMHFELEGLDPEEYSALEQAILERLTLAQTAVRDFAAMRNQVGTAIHALSRLGGQQPERAEEVEEATGLLRWLLDANFVFLGHAFYDIQGDVQGDGQGDPFVSTSRDALGLNRPAEAGFGAQTDALNRKPFPTVALEWARGQTLTRIDKAPEESPLHRSGRLDRIFVRRLNDQGQQEGISVFQGLFTYKGLRQHGSNIPLLRARLQRVLEHEEAVGGSHLYHALVAAFDVLPIEYLFNASDEALLRAVSLVVAADEGQDTSVSVQIEEQLDDQARSMVLLCSLPRRHYDDGLREAICRTVASETGASYVDYRLETTPSGRVVLTVFLTSPEGAQAVKEPSSSGSTANETQDVVPVNVQSLEAQILQLSRPWEERFQRLLERARPGESDELMARFGQAFPESYLLQVSPEEAVTDVTHLEGLVAGRDLQVRVVPDHENPQPSNARLKIYQLTNLHLTDSLPVFHNFGLRVVNQSNFPVAPEGIGAFIDIFRIDGIQGRADVDLQAAGPLLAEGIHEVLAGQAENDVLNRLVLLAGLSWRQVNVLRAYLAYARQIENIPHDYLRRVLLSHPKCARQAFELFEARLDPSLGSAGSAERAQLVHLRRERFDAYLKGVESAAEDRVLRLLLRLIEATLRTNYFRTPTRAFLSFKLDSELAIPGMVGLRPFKEIFVYHPAVEGIHLRGSPIARGGLRWSDRYDDYRAEILDLMRTQMVKNVLIVPGGAKGGFILKQQARNREHERELADAMYQIFIRGLLDVTDNDVTGPNGVSRIMSPPEVVVHDDEDPYLVVAADKGTAHLSDTANAISLEYGFWLGDAFASGGSNGYDHKKEAITAKGAWECVKRHFWELGMDPERQEFTCVGIGDMSGDVFGNGMLLSRTLKLVAAFNHLHIFLDPQPDPAKSFEERSRLFHLPRSTWDDYRRDTLSRGGGIFRRSAKAIELSPEVQALLGVTASTLSGDEIVKRILTLQVDLLWNGGIGTYVKASTQTHAEVGDRVNDAVRVDAKDVRAKVVGEGGNLGFTQAARIEFALAGGHLNTDAVDNSGGVDMSDHEVNLKILFQPLVASGRLTLAARNALLVQMTGAVSEFVLSDNRGQSLLLSLDALRSIDDYRPFHYLIEDLMSSMKLDRAGERLPDLRTLEARAEKDQGLTRPELARMVGLTKMAVRQGLQRDARLQGPFIEQLLFGYFPQEVRQQFADAVRNHPLRQEIIATTLTSRILDFAGITFFQEIVEDTGHSIPEVAMAYLISTELLDAHALRQTILDPAQQLSADAQYRALLDLEYAIAAHSRRTLQRGYNVFEPETLITQLKAALNDLKHRLVEVLPARAYANLQREIQDYQSLGIPAELAARVASLHYMSSASDIAQLKDQSGLSLQDAAWLYHAVGEETRVRAAYELSYGSEPQDRWENSAMVLLQGRLLATQYHLTRKIASKDQQSTPRARLDKFLAEQSAVIHRIREVESRLVQGKGRGVAAITVMMAVVQELNV